MLCVCFYHFKTSYSQTPPKQKFNFDHFESTPDRPEQLTPCHIPTGRASFCVPLDRCNQLSALIKNLQKPIPTDVALYVKDSFYCPSTNNVCCPFNSIINPKPENRPAIRNRGTNGFLMNNIVVK